MRRRRRGGMSGDSRPGRLAGARRVPRPGRLRLWCAKRGRAPRGRWERPLAHAFLVLGLAAAVLGLAGLVAEQGEGGAYAGLVTRAQAQVAPIDDGAGEEGVDWDALKAQNGDVAAWVRVEGTDVDYPVVAPSEGDMAYYLGHDFWGTPTFVGCPFLDAGTSADAAHALAYGHHLGSSGMFSQLRPCFDQAAFDRLGACHWSTPGAGRLDLRPLCALRVDQADEGVRRFSFTDQGQLRAWLAEEVGRSSASCPDARALAAQATRAVSLVTCASPVGGQRWRTVVVFVV